MWTGFLTRIERNFSRFLHFAGLSGGGWLLDFALLQIFVSVVGLPIVVGNILSSCIASLFVFTVSRHMIFDKAGGATAFRFAVYLLYTISIILAASFLAVYVQSGIEKLSQAWQVELPNSVVLALTKIAITPPQLILNFLVSKFVIETGLGTTNDRSL